MLHLREINVRISEEFHYFHTKHFLVLCVISCDSQTHTRTTSPLTSILPKSISLVCVLVFEFTVTFFVILPIFFIFNLRLFVVFVPLPAKV